MNDICKGEIVLEADLTPQAREKLVSILLEVYHSHTPEQLTAFVSGPKPLVLIRNVEETRARKFVEALRAQGAPLVFIPYRQKVEDIPPNTPVPTSQPSRPDTQMGRATSTELNQNSYSSSSEINSERAENEPAVQVSRKESARSDRTIAGFWRRLGAFQIDIIVLAVVGILLGLVFSDFFMRIGSLGRLIGFPIALLYFGVQNSSILGGQTIGKRLLGIKVVSLNGSPISLPRSIARSNVLILPYFLNGVYFPFTQLPQVLQLAISLLLAAIVFGMGLSLIYLFVFNRRTRQSLHDIFAKTFVVVERAETVSPRIGTWPVHYAVIVLFLLMSISLPYILTKNITLDPGITALYENLAYNENYTYVQVLDRKSIFNGVQSTSVAVNVGMKEEPITFQDAAVEIAENALSLFPGIEKRDFLTVSITRGFDIGIWSVSRTESFNYTPALWRQHLQEGPSPTIDL